MERRNERYSFDFTDNKLDLKSVSIQLRNNNGANTKQPLATCIVTFNNDLVMRDVAVWQGSDNVLYTSYPGRSYNAVNEKGEQETKTFKQAYFTHSSGKNEEFTAKIVDCYKQALVQHNSKEIERTQSVDSIDDLDNNLELLEAGGRRA